MILKQVFTVRIPTPDFNSPHFYLQLIPLESKNHPISYILFSEADFLHHKLPIPSPILNEEGYVSEYLWLKTITLNLQSSKRNGPLESTDLVIFSLSKNYSVQRSRNGFRRSTIRTVKLTTEGHPHYPSQLPPTVYDLTLYLNRKKFSQFNYLSKDTNNVFKVSLSP